MLAAIVQTRGNLKPGNDAGDAVKAAATRHRIAVRANRNGAQARLSSGAPAGQAG